MIPPAAIEIVTTSLGDGVVDETYGATIEANGGTEQGFDWTLAGGALPDGLTLRSSGTPSTRLSGTPTESGSFSITVQVTDSAGTTDTQELTFEIAGPPPPLEITTAELPNGGTGLAYSGEITATGGSGEGYTWRIEDGGLPAGVTLATDGTPSTTLSGTIPNESAIAGDYTFAISVTDSENNRVETSFDIVIEDNFVPLTIVTTDIPDADENVPYEATIEAQGGEGEYSWRIQGGELPPGLSLDDESSGATTTISGTPSMAGSFTFQVEVRDDGGASPARKTIFMEVAPEPPPVRITTVELPPAEQGSPYSATLAAINGTETGYTWAVIEGALPAGLTLTAMSPAGTQETTITGTPTEFGTFDFSIEVTDSRGNTDDTSFQLSVQEEVIPIQITGATNGLIVLPNARGGEDYSTTLSAQDGFGNYNWVASGLPRGLALQVPGTPSTVLAGLPQELGTFTATVTVYDLDNETDSVQVQITVDPPDTLPTITTSALPGAPICGGYARSIAGTGGSNANYTWSVIAGSLPPGFVLSPTGTPAAVVRGTTGTQTGSYSFTVQLTDTFGLTDTQNLTIDVVNAPGGFRWAMHMGDVQSSAFNEIFIQEVCGSPSTTPINVTAPNAPSGSDGIWTSSYFAAGFAPNGESLAYVGDLTVDGRDDVYVVDLRSGTPSTPVLVSDGIGLSGANSASYMKYSPDGTKLSFVADPNVSSGYELFVVDLTDPANPGPAHRVSPQAASTTTDVTLYDWMFSPDGTKIVYEGAVTASSEYRHYYVDLSALPSGGAPSAPMVVHDVSYTSADTNGIFQWTPDSRAIVYNADFAGTTSVDSMFWVDLSGPTPGTPVMLNPPLPTNADCYSSSGTDFGLGWSISPDGSKVAVLCEAELDNARWPYIVDISGTVPGPMVRAVTSDPVTNRYVNRLRWSPDSTHLLFHGDLGPADNAVELYMVDVSGTLPAPMQTIAPTTDGNLEMYTSPYHFAAFTPDMQRVLYIGDFDTNSANELYMVTVGNGPPYQRVKLNTPFTTEDVYHFQISPDGEKVAAFVLASGIYSLFVVDISGPTPGPWVRAHSTPLSSSYDLTTSNTTGWQGGWHWFWTPDSDSLVFVAGLANSGVDELWISDVSGTPPFVEQRLSVPNTNSSLDVFRAWAQGDYALPWQLQRQ